VQKTSDFSKFMVCPHGQGEGEGGLSQCVHFSDKEGGVNFSRFCADVFYGRPLMHVYIFGIQRLLISEMHKFNHLNILTQFVHKHKAIGTAIFKTFKRSQNINYSN